MKKSDEKFAQEAKSLFDGSVEKLMETIRSQVAMEGSGVLHYDEPSRSLIVLQPQSVQSSLEAFLTQMR